METTKVALLGLGTMGLGMAGRLLDAGYPLTVYNRTPAKAERLKERGAKVAKTPAEAASGAEIIFSMVSDDDASRLVWAARDGALAGAAPNTTLVESSTLTADWIEELDSAARARNMVLIDAPVTGSKIQAASGQLLFLAGGPEAALAKITPALRAMGRGVVHLGPTGSGVRMKLINNFLAAVQAASLGEAFGLIERSGLNVDQAFGILSEGAPGSPMVKRIGARMVAREYTAPDFSTRLMAKDLRYVLVMDRESSGNSSLAIAAAALHDFEGAIAKGHGEKDLSVAELFRKK